MDDGLKERTARIEEKVTYISEQMDDLRRTEKNVHEAISMAESADARARSAHKRIDHIDKWMFAIGSAVLTIIIGAVVGSVIVLG